MMSRLLSSLIACCWLAGLAFSASNAAADEALFSDVKINSVFADDAKSSTNSETPASAVAKIRSVDHLGRLLRIEGFGFEKVGERTYGATTEIGDWTFPTLVTLSPDSKRVGLILGLVRFDDDKALTSSLMRTLLVANQKIAPYQFSFNEERSRTELAIVLPNEAIDSGRLAREITRLKEIGRDSSKFWYDDSSKSESADEQPIAKSPTTPPATPSPSLSVSQLVGKWAYAKSSTEAFALELSSAGRFKLVHVAAGKVNTSEGTFGLQGDTLVLNVPNASSLSGPIKMTGSDEFRLSLTGVAEPLVFKRSAQ